MAIEVSGGRQIPLTGKATSLSMHALIALDEEVIFQILISFVDQVSLCDGEQLDVIYSHLPIATGTMARHLWRGWTTEEYKDAASVQITWVHALA